MRTQCNECGKKFTVEDNAFLTQINCKYCGAEFTATYAPENRDVDINVNGHTDNTNAKTAKDEILEEIKAIKPNLAPILPAINAAILNKENESNTRLILDKILQDVLGYAIEDMKTEQKIQGKKADYVMSVEGKDVMVIEAKKAGMTLRDKQVFQATSYAAYSGIKWALLTNGAVWQLYRVTVMNKVKYIPMYSIDIREGLSRVRDAQYFYLLSKNGMKKQNLLENLWIKIDALRYDNLVNTLLKDEILTAIAESLTEEFGCRLTAREVKATLLTDILQIESK
ncbi:MAG: type I restriction enzyme HsdR N-terminal domain-containing protein [Desulfococcaceae bacterium]|nr:type I restriction enzyme HsdR N-terminal domain-containing protein [Desulfococcaceae bacterium]